MIKQSDLTEREVRSLLRNGSIQLAGNKNLKIYGTLRCHSGKRMKRENRIFFKNQGDAESEGYRPCKNCMRELYKKKRDSHNCP